MNVYHRQQLRRAYSDVCSSPAGLTATHTSAIDENTIPSLVDAGLVKRSPLKTYGCTLTQPGVDYVRAAWPGMSH